MRAVRRLASLALGLLALARPQSASAAPPPSLVVVVVVDQLAAHEIERWQHLFEGGLRELMSRGAVYTQARYAYANTETAAGHATAMTGAWPSVHGIISNYWHEEGTGRRTYCYEDAEHGRSPDRLAVPVFADALKLATAGRAKVLSISLKDRAAIPMGGTRPDLSAWYEAETGTFVSAAWPGAKTPTWFRGAAAPYGAESARGTTWARVRPDVDYVAEAGPDDHPAEEDVGGLGRTFPHVVAADIEPATLRDIYRVTPAALEGHFALVRRALEEEQLGLRGTTDMLAIGVSTTDFTGHWFGAYSHEHLDAVLRVDRALGALFEHLAKTRGRDRVLIALTADHGAVLAPEKARLLGIEARRTSKQAVQDAAQAACGAEATVLKVNAPYVYLAPTAAKVDRTALRRRVAQAVMSVPGVVEAVALEDLHTLTAPFDTLFARSTFRGRRADVYLRTRPGTYVSRVDAAGNGQGTGHGSPYVYDMAVPLMFAGPGVRPGLFRAPVDMTRMAPTLAALLGIPPPAAALQAPLDAAGR